MRSLPALALSLLFLSCGGSGGGDSQGSVSAPTGLQATAGPGPNAITLAWTSPQGGADGYNLELQVGSGAFAQVNTGLIPPNWTGVVVTFNSNPPEFNVYTFRMDSKRGSAVSSYSNTAVVSYGLNVPGQPMAQYDFDQKGVRISWVRNTTVSDGLLVERVETDFYGTVQGIWVALPVSDPLASTYVDTDARLNTHFSYRVTNLKGANASHPSIPSYAILAGLLAPDSLFAGWNLNTDGVALSWSGPPIYDSFDLERSQCDSTGATVGGWSNVATVPGNAKTYTDLATQELTPYLYRITGTRLTTTSLPVISYPITTPMFSPINLLASTVQGGIQLTWQNRSQIAAQVAINRNGPGTPSPLALLSSEATAYLDSGPPLGYFNYWLVAQNGSNSASSAPVMAVTPNPPGALSLIATTLAYPAAIDACIRPYGTWAFLGGEPFGVLSNNDIWQPFFPNNFRLWDPATIQVDSKGWPHAVFLALDPQNSQNRFLTHIWTDGSKWQSEVIGQTNITNPAGKTVYTYQLDSTGTPQVLLDHSDSSYEPGGSTTTLTFVHKVNETWVSDSLASLDPAITDIGSFRLLLDTNDVPHIMLGNWSALIDYTRDGGGGWTSNTLPTGTLVSGGPEFLDGVWTDANTASIFYPNSYGGYSSETPLMMLQKIGGAWRPPIKVGSKDFYFGSNPTPQFAFSSDRTRMAVLFNTSVGLKTCHQNGTGWVESLVAPPSPYLWMRFGFDVNDKLHIITNDTFTSGFTEYREQ